MVRSFLNKIKGSDKNVASMGKRNSRHLVNYRCVH
jgi:hypothetical protein